MKTKSKPKLKLKIKIKMNFGFCFPFIFDFRFVLFFVLLFKSFCICVNSTWPSGAIDGQLSLDWPRSAIAFLLNPRGLRVPQTVNSLLLGLEKCHSIFICEISTCPSGAIDGQFSLDWPRSAIAPRNMVPGLIRTRRIQ